MRWSRTRAVLCNGGQRFASPPGDAVPRGRRGTGAAAGGLWRTVCLAVDTCMRDECAPAHSMHARPRRVRLKTLRARPCEAPSSGGPRRSWLPAMVACSPCTHPARPHPLAPCTQCTHARTQAGAAQVGNLPPKPTAGPPAATEMSPACTEAHGTSRARACTPPKPSSEQPPLCVQKGAGRPWLPMPLQCRPGTDQAEVAGGHSAPCVHQCPTPCTCSRAHRASQGTARRWRRPTQPCMRELHSAASIAAAPPSPSTAAP